MALATLAFLPQHHSLMQLTRCCSSVLYYIGTMDYFIRTLFKFLEIVNTHLRSLLIYLIRIVFFTFCFLMPYPTYFNYKSKKILDLSKLLLIGSNYLRQFNFKYMIISFLNHIQIEDLFWNCPKPFGRVQNCFGFIEG